MGAWQQESSSPWPVSCAVAAHSLCCLADLPSMPMQSGSVGQYGATQYASQQAAPSQTPTMVPARPQQATQASTYSTTPYSRPPAQPLRSPAAPATAAPAFGRPSVQAPAGNRASAITRAGTQLAAAKPTVPVASAGKANLHRPLALSQQPFGGRVMAILLTRLSYHSSHLSYEGSISASGVCVFFKVGAYNIHFDCRAHGSDSCKAPAQQCPHWAPSCCWAERPRDSSVGRLHARKAGQLSRPRASSWTRQGARQGACDCCATSWQC